MTGGKEDTIALLCLEASLVVEVMPEVMGSQDRIVVSVQQVTAWGRSHGRRYIYSKDSVSFCALAVLAWDAYLHASERAQ